MPDFSAELTAGAAGEIWIDPPVPEGPSTGAGGAPSRLNPDVNYPHTYRAVQLGSSVMIQASVNGVPAPLDVALGGRLFTTHFAEVPVWPAPAIALTPGQSSVATFTPTELGHHLVVMRRQGGGGAVAIPFQLEVA